MDVPCCSARFIQPFARVLSTYESYATELERLNAIDPASRIPFLVVNELVDHQVRQTGDPDLGLRAGRTMALGCAGALDYAMHSAATVRQAIALAARYGRLFSDVLSVRLDVQGARATVRVESTVPVPRAVPDFSMSAWYANHTRATVGDPERIECWFSHPKPPSTIEYERTFAPATLRFSAPFYGFTFDKERLDAPLPSADPAIHLLLCEHVALMHAQLSQHRTLVGRVREIAMREVSQGELTVSAVARQLRMSARTLSRKLEREGTSFSALADHLRQELALRYVGNHELTFADIASRLGFSHVEAFYRAFKRWTGQTPLTYRRAHRPTDRFEAYRR